MAPSSRHLHHAWLRPPSTNEPGATGTPPVVQRDGAWQVWERLRAFDRRYATLVDVGLAVALFVLSSGWLVEQTAARPSLWFVAALTFPLVFRRRAPMAVFLVISALAFAQWLVAQPGVADASLLIALYTVALESVWVLVVAASVIVEVGVVMATTRWVPTGNHLKSFVFLSGLAFAALLAGVVVRTLRAQLDWLAERAQRLEIERDQQASLAAAAERSRIAREMHDVVSHNLQVMVTLADAATAAQASDPGRAAEVMREVSSTGRQALTDMRRMLGVLRDGPPAGNTARHPGPGTDRAPLAPQPGLDELNALVSRVGGTGLPVTLERTGRPFEVTGAAGLTIYRIVQEALTNTLKHARAPHSVEVHLDFDDPDVSVRVADDGEDPVLARVSAPLTPEGADTIPEGRAPTRVAGTRGGHGVTGMAERAAAFGGTLEAGPRSGGGWEVRTTLRDCKASTSP